MSKEKHDNSKHSKSHHVQQAGLEETKVLAEIGAHAAILNRTSANQLSSNRQLLLQLQRQYGNSYVQQVMQQMQHTRELVPSASTQQPNVQRRIIINPNAYLKGLGVSSENLTDDQIDEYIKIVVFDDFKRAIKFSKDGGKELKAMWKKVRDKKTTNQDKLKQLQELINLLNQINTQPNRETRYASTPKEETGYVHTNLSSGKEEVTKWEDDTDMWKKFGEEIGEGVAKNSYTEELPSAASDPTVSMEKRAALPLKQLPWNLAKQILPRPLINLIFDIRYQLETEGSVIVDERTQEEQSNKQKSPRAPGSLRSWHQDSKGLLPSNNFPNSVPNHASNLHIHYTNTSQSGAGSSIKEAVNNPIGYAEYTGTGSDWEHNTKIVLDYIKKRVYLTLTHYQYWALIEKNGTFEFWSSGTQDLVKAKGDLQRKKEPESKAFMMSPWMEILF